MDFVFSSMGMPFNGNTIKSESLGGSETSAYYLARELAERGHRVTMFTSSRDEGTFDGVTYCWHGEPSQQYPLGERFHFYAENTPHDVTYVQRHPLAFMRKFASKANVWALHDLALFRTAGVTQQNIRMVDAVTVVSEWHKQQVIDVYGIERDHVHVVPNGVDPLLYRNSDVNWTHKPVRVADVERPATLTEKVDDTDVQFMVLPSRGFNMLYQSRPERGLEHLVRPGGIMERLAKECPQANLIIVGYDNTAGHMRAYYEQLNAWANLLPNVVHLGALDKPRLAELQMHCDLLIYPTEFEEVSCITAMEAMHAGLPMLTSGQAALNETCADSGTILVPLKDGKADEDAFVEQVLALYSNLNDPEREGVSRLAQLSEAQHFAAGRCTWARAAERLDEMVRGLFARKTDAAVVRHCIEHSDIGFLDWLRDNHLQGDNAIVKRTLAELDTMYDFRTSPERYAAHYHYHQSRYYDTMGDRVLFGQDGSSRTTRFMGTATALEGELIRLSKERGGGQLRVLDYGCAHGHYLMEFAQAFPEHQFVGLDISQRAIDGATKWRDQAGLRNVDLYCGSQDALAGIGKFDVIIAGEVVEHVNDYVDLLNRLGDALIPGGALVVTTPYGRWEWMGREEFRKAREHLHHFERADILDICEGMDVNLQFAPASKDQTGAMCGSWVWRVRPGTRRFRGVNYARKLRQLRPRETVGLLMIVKNGENTLGKALESAAGWVDTVAIGYDPSTTDATAEVIERAEQVNRWVPITKILLPAPVLEIGFDAARNHVLDALDTDWVFWMDADEVLQRPENFWNLLHDGPFNAYAIPQIHYSVEPAQVLTTDYPCRLFRNHRGVQFYGVVHEHPEDAPGKAIAHTMMTDTVKVLHGGYVDETTRRNRFARNYPLLERDIEKHPTRLLNKFLMLRDVAQSIGFEQEQAGGRVLEGHVERAQKGIKIFEELLDVPNLRMVMDALQFYSHCVATLGTGFEAEIRLATRTEAAPDLAVNSEAKGRFLNRQHFKRLLDRITEESIKHYEAKHL